MTIEFTLFLSAWIRRHVMTIDRRLGQYLTTRQPNPAPSGSIGIRDPRVP
ncbi:MAG: hypothetical protein ABSH56_24765 [Bryobacteraceae bacterium]